MISNPQSRLQGLTPREVQILRTVKEAGALLEPELPLRLDRDGDNLRPELENLRRRNLVQVRTVEYEGETIKIYLTARGIGRLL